MKKCKKISEKKDENYLCKPNLNMGKKETKKESNKKLINSMKEEKEPKN